MRKILGACFLWLALGAAAHAAGPDRLLMGVGPSHGGTYTGPGDLSVNSSIVAWWGFRPYSSTYTGNVAQIVNSNSGKTTILHSTAGSLDVVAGQDSLATLVADCNSSHAYCSVSTWYDQSGKILCFVSIACDLIETNGSSQVISNCPSLTSPYRFCLVTGSNSYYWDASNLGSSITTPFSLLVLEKPLLVTGYGISFEADPAFVDVNTAGGGGFRYNNGATTITISQDTSGWNIEAAADLNSASLSSYFQLNDGTPSTGILGTASITGPIRIGHGVNLLYVEEAGIWSTDIHTSFTTYYNNASGYLGGF